MIKSDLETNKLDEITNNAIAILNHLNNIFNNYDSNSELSKFNLSKKNIKTEISPEFNELLKINGYRSKVDIRNEKIGYKIREATLGRVPLIAVIGDKEEEIDSVALRALDGTNLGIFDLPNLYKLMDELIEKKGRTE